MFGKFPKRRRVCLINDGWIYYPRGVRRIHFDGANGHILGNLTVAETRS